MRPGLRRPSSVPPERRRRDDVNRPQNQLFIVTVATPPALAAKRATTRIPIVMATAGDPARLGVVASFARPGGTLTGVTLYGTELNGKRIELFREAIPGIKRIEATARLTYFFLCGRWDSNPHDVAIEGF